MVFKGRFTIKRQLCYPRARICFLLLYVGPTGQGGFRTTEPPNYHMTKYNINERDSNSGFEDWSCALSRPTA